MLRQQKECKGRNVTHWLVNKQIWNTPIEYSPEEMMHT